MAANQIDQCHYISPAAAALGAAGLSALAGGGGAAGAGSSGSDRKGLPQADRLSGREPYVNK